MSGPWRRGRGPGTAAMNASNKHTGAPYRRGQAPAFALVVTMLMMSMVVVLALALLAIVVQDFGLFVLVDGASLAGPVAVVMQAVVLLVGIALLLLARSARARGWLV